ncbi:Putative Holo-[acyl-carrier-protein] synthase [Kitasatospora sp. MMS16-BH015]|uniref:holo-ACP synthase n=1 Tax=Kitasatospora sp. MMS16-BH015 TaxID=2018025 RepID=UPI000CA3BEAE|nr:holo-ACP synthase [Kitasatospora sp. MMS16-BH015]AUG80688.1 Putative Holo-[acyl-carrier-protein] synthase [Kitasatospora sp. MMS16-BH015]
MAHGTTVPDRSAAPWGPLGLDIVSAQRVRGIIEEHGEAFLSRMLTERELADCRVDTGLHLLTVCGRIAAKEAAFKALRVTGRPMPWLEIEIRRGPGGWPTVELFGEAAALAAEAGIERIGVSISHDVDYAVAVGAPLPTD